MNACELGVGEAIVNFRARIMKYFVTELITVAAVFLLAIAPQFTTKAAGITLIAHGFEDDVSFPTWVSSMADQMPTYFSGRFPGLNTNFTTYRLVVTHNGNGYSFSSTRTNGLSPFTTQSGEIVVELDWSALSGDASDSFADTYNVGWAVSQILMLTNAVSELNGHALSEFSIHLIGHSRGGSLVSQISYVLGTNGLWVDHVTTLDPYPINNDGDDDFGFSYEDASADHTYANVLFADNYWQDLGAGAYFGDPDGEPVSGAYVRQLTDLEGGYNNTGLFSTYHSNVHLWYYGTINLNTPANDTGASITSTERTAWWVPYEDYGLNAGFAYSLLGGANRTNTAIPLGLPSDPTVVSGFNQYWNLGGGTSANRTPLTVNSGAWPNVIRFDLLGTNVVSQNSFASTTLYYQYGGSSNLTIQVFLDQDFNPYNTNSIAVLTVQPPASGTGSVYYYTSLSFSTTNVPPGYYSIYAKITDGKHIRYMYTPELLQITSQVQSPNLAIANIGNAKINVIVNGVSGQKIVLQSSNDLKSWAPIATNTLTTSTWIYAGVSQTNRQYFRAMLSQ
jgi:hypothetical protein